jgi:hypothetical protein
MASFTITTKSLKGQLLVKKKKKKKKKKLHRLKAIYNKLYIIRYIITSCAYISLYQRCISAHFRCLKMERSDKLSVTSSLYNLDVNMLFNIQER